MRVGVLSQQFPSGRCEKASCFGRYHGTGVAVEQLLPEGIFQLLDGSRDQRGRDPFAAGHYGKTLVIVNRDEKLKGAKIDAAGIGHLCNSCNSVFCIIPFIASARCFILSRLLYRGGAVMALLFILLVIAGGMGLSVEAGLLGPLASQVGDLWATMSIFGIGAVLTFFLMLFFSPRSSPSFFSLPGWQLTGGLLGAGYVVILTVATPVIGIAMTMIGILAGQVAKSLAIDHYGLFGSPRRKIDPRRAMALMLIMAALLLVALG